MHHPDAVQRMEDSHTGCMRPDNCPIKDMQADAFTAAVQTGVRACVAGGKVVIVGLGSEEAKIPISVAACKELDISGSFRYCNTVRTPPNHL